MELFAENHRRNAQIVIIFCEDQRTNPIDLRETNK